MRAKMLRLILFVIPALHSEQSSAQTHPDLESGARWTVEAALATNHTGVLWDAASAEGLYLCPAGKHLYLLTYVALYRLSTTSLNIEATFRVPYAPGAGMLSLAESSDCSKLAVYQMPGRLLLMTPDWLAPTGSCVVNIADFIARSRWVGSSNLLVAFGDRGALDRIAFGSEPKVLSEYRFSGVGLGALDADDAGILFLTGGGPGIVERFDAPGGKILEPVRIHSNGATNSSTGPDAARLRFFQIAVDRAQHRIFVQGLRRFGEVPPKDTLLALSAEGTVLGRWEAPMATRHLQRTTASRFVFYGDGGTLVTIHAIDTGTLKSTVCAQLECSDFAVSPTASTLYYAKYSGKNALLGIMRLTPP
jgi:hypothetical protein